MSIYIHITNSMPAYANALDIHGRLENSGPNGGFVRWEHQLTT